MIEADILRNKRCLSFLRTPFTHTAVRSEERRTSLIRCTLNLLSPQPPTCLPVHVLSTGLFVVCRDVRETVTKVGQRSRLNTLDFGVDLKGLQNFEDCVLK